MKQDLELESSELVDLGTETDGDLSREIMLKIINLSPSQRKHPLELTEEITTVQNKNLT
jgi:hypothetical protein